MIQTGQVNIQQAHIAKQVILETAATLGASGPQCTQAACNFGQ